jgi:hypothetical protein
MSICAEDANHPSDRQRSRPRYILASTAGSGGSPPLEATGFRHGNPRRATTSKPVLTWHEAIIVVQSRLRRRMTVAGEMVLESGRLDHRDRHREYRRLRA